MMEIGRDPQPILAIRCLTYNHGKYIRQCLEGFVMQKTTFPFIAIVHDDASTDDTPEIIKKYEKRYPNIIKPIYEAENQYSKRNGSIDKCLEEATPESVKYIAICEGDDYWIDPNKLQKQVDFLESHSEYIFCCTRYKIYDQDKKIYHKEYADSYYQKEANLEISLDLFFKTWVTQPLTALFRKDDYMDVTSTSQYKYFRDVHLFYLLLLHGRGISLNTVTGIYRWHTGGIASKIRVDKKYQDNYLIIKELYLANKHEPHIKIQYKISLIMFLRYSSDIKFAYTELCSAFNILTFSEKIRCIFAFTIPKHIFILLHYIKYGTLS